MKMTEYEMFLTAKNVPESKWRKGIMIYNKNNNSYERMKVGDFTLGSCQYIMGILGSESDKKIIASILICIVKKS